MRGGRQMTHRIERLTGLNSHSSSYVFSPKGSPNRGKRDSRQFLLQNSMDTIMSIALSMGSRVTLELHWLRVPANLVQLRKVPAG